jgi:hypothetical protein
MKTFTDYGKGKTKILHSCLIEIEDTSEWTAISTALENELQREHKNLRECRECDIDTGYIEKRIVTLERCIARLEPLNTIPLEQFNLAKIKKELWRKETDEEGEVKP